MSAPWSVGASVSAVIPPRQRPTLKLGTGKRMAELARRRFYVVPVISLLLTSPLTLVPATAGEPPFTIATHLSEKNSLVEVLRKVLREYGSKHRSSEWTLEVLPTRNYQPENNLAQVANFEADMTILIQRQRDNLLSQYPHFQVIGLPNLAPSSAIGSVALLETVRSTGLQLRGALSELIVLSVGVSFPPSLHLRYEVKSIHGLKGMRILTPNARTADALRFIGLKAVNDTYAYVREEAQRRAADALALSWWELSQMQVGEEYLYHLELPLGSFAIALVTNRKTLERLGLDKRGAVSDANKFDFGMELTKRWGEVYDSIFKDYRSRQMSAGGRIVRLDVDETRKYIEEAYTRWKDTGDEHEEVLESYKKIIEEKISEKKK